MPSCTVANVDIISPHSLCRGHLTLPHIGIPSYTSVRVYVISTAIYSCAAVCVDVFSQSSMSSRHLTLQYVMTHSETAACVDLSFKLFVFREMAWWPRLAVPDKRSVCTSASRPSHFGRQQTPSSKSVIAHGYLWTGVQCEPASSNHRIWWRVQIAWELPLNNRHNNFRVKNKLRCSLFEATSGNQSSFYHLKYHFTILFLNSKNSSFISFFAIIKHFFSDLGFISMNDGKII